MNSYLRDFRIGHLTIMCVIGRQRERNRRNFSRRYATILPTFSRNQRGNINMVNHYQVTIPIQKYFNIIKLTSSKVNLNLNQLMISKKKQMKTLSLQYNIPMLYLSWRKEEVQQMYQLLTFNHKNLTIRKNNHTMNKALY